MRKKAERMRQDKIREQDPYATKKQISSQHLFKACTLMDSYDMQGSRQGDYHGAREMSLGLKNSLSLPSATTLQFIETTYKPTPTPLFKVDNPSDLTCVPTSVFESRYPTCWVLDCPCEDKSPFHKGYAAMADSGDWCAYWGKTFS
jgi:hypothetical protein